MLEELDEIKEKMKKNDDYIDFIKYFERIDDDEYLKLKEAKKLFEIILYCFRNNK